MDEPRRVSPTELVRVVEALLMPIRVKMEAIVERQRAIEKGQRKQEKLLFALHDRLDFMVERDK